MKRIIATKGYQPRTCLLTDRLVSRLAIVTLVFICMMHISFTDLSIASNLVPNNPVESTAFHGKVLKTIIVADYYPYSFVNEKGLPDGFSVDIAKAVGQVMDLKLEISVDTWENAKKALENGSIDFLPMMAYSSERSKSFDFSVPHTIAYDSVFVRKGTPRIRTLEDLSGKTVIIMNRDAAHDFLESSGMSDKMKLVLLDDLPDMLRLLASGNGDAALLPKLVGMVVLKKLNITNVEESSEIVDEYNRSFSFTVKKGDAALLERLNQGLTIVKITGQYEDIYKKWFSVLEPRGVPWRSALKYAAVAVVVFSLIVIFLLLWSVSLKKVVRLRTKTLEAEIAERRKTENALRESEARYRAVFENAAMGIDALDRDGRISQVNPALSNMLGYTEDELKGRTFDDITHPDDRQVSKQNLESLIKGEIDSYRLQKRYLRKNGEIVWGDVTSSSIKDANGNCTGVVAVIADTTDRKKTEEALFQSEARRRLAQDAAKAGTWEWDLRTNENFWSEELWGLYGLEPHSCEPSYDAWRQTIHPDDRAMAERVVQEAAFKGAELSAEWRIQDNEGSMRWLMSRGRPVSDATGQVVRYIGICIDITERKRTEEQLRRSEERYLSLFQDAPLMYVITRNEQGVPIITDCNKSFLSSLGFAQEEVIGKPLADFYSSESCYRLLEGGGYARALTGEFVMGERQLLAHDGSMIQTLLYTCPERDHAGHVIGTRAMFVDITSERIAQATQRLLATAIDQATEGVIVTDTDGTIQYVNPAMCSITGYSQEELVGSNPSLLKSGKQDSIFYKHLWDTIKSGHIWNGRLVNRKKDGGLYHEDSTISPVKDSSGKIVNFVGVKRDITEHLELSKQLFQAQKMEAVGTLAGGIAHDFNNLLQAINGYTELLMMRRKQDDPELEDLKRIYDSTKRGADLVKSLMMFSRRTKPELRPVDLNHEVVEVQKILSKTIPKIIQFELRLSGKVESINADPSQIGQIIMNLGINARDAMPDGGTLTIETSIVDLDKAYSAVQPELRPGHYVLLTVSDTGHGMEKHTVEHIFDPFFTTKEVGKGTGLGLATVYGIVKEHKGHIACYSELGIGTTFKIYLPAIQTEKTSETLTEETPIQGGTETILLVEDEAVIRDLGARLLNEYGYNVITANDGKQALEIYQRESERISLIILDLLMPVMDGRQCLVEIFKINPDVKVIIASGVTEEDSTKVIHVKGAKGSIKKPYDVRQLLRLVREVLDKDLEEKTTCKTMKSPTNL